MKILLILLDAFASKLVISTTYAAKKGSEENSHFSLEKDHQEKEQNRFLHKSVDMGRKVEGGIKGTPYAIGSKSLAEKSDNIKVTKKTDDDDDKGD
ncbi:hypothetical protein MRB53_001250 [Persea americana]|uniref:Uncharacterized protein n=1 Tax=Persea americana TaxID=3435 RepID=A0ACC2MTI9_PERAE|nr:hypothetical protein MRB53_001250 [Persea americana]